MRIVRNLIVGALCLVGAAFAVRADDLVSLHNGETLRGEIVRQTSAEVEIRLTNPSRTITYGRTIPRSEIKSIQQESADEKVHRELGVAYSELSKYQVAAYSHPVAYYGEAIAAFERFLAKCPAGTQRDEIAARLRSFNEEAGRVGKGSVKWKDKWYEGDLAKTVVNEIKATQLLAVAAETINRGAYEAGFVKSREIMWVRPLPLDLVQRAGQLATDACQRWSKAVAAREAEIPAEIQGQELLIQAQTRAKAQCEEQLRALEQEQSLIGQARNEKGSNSTTGRWVVRDSVGRIIKDYGGMLPSIRSSAFADARAGASRAAAEIDKANAVIRQLQTEQSGIKTKLQNIATQQQQFSADLAMLRQEAQLIAQGGTPAASVAGSDATVVASASQPSPEAANPAAPTAESEANTPKAVKAKTARQQPEAVESWLKRKWYILAGVLLVGWLATRVRFVRD